MFNTSCVTLNTSHGYLTTISSNKDSH